MQLELCCCDTEDNCNDTPEHQLGMQKIDAAALICFSKYTQSNASGYAFTDAIGGVPTCATDKWCVTTTRTSEDDGNMAGYVHAKCAAASEHQVCDTHAANKCWTVAAASVKTELCCCNWDACNDTPFAFGKQQLPGRATTTTPRPTTTTDARVGASVQIGKCHAPFVPCHHIRSTR